MSETAEANGAAAVRVPFGDLPNQSVPLDWAEAMLRNWRERDPEGFGYVLAQLATGAPPKAPTRRSGRAQQ